MKIIMGAVIGIAVGLFLFSYIFYSFWQHLGENISNKLRKRYLAALMRQEVSYFEKN
jgi:ABC-type multidrug transport system fused ATPase/permease subunit